MIKVKNRENIRHQQNNERLIGIKLYTIFENFNHIFIQPSLLNYGQPSKWRKFRVYVQHINLWIWCIKCLLNYLYDTELANSLLANPFMLFRKGGEMALIVSGFVLTFNSMGNY